MGGRSRSRGRKKCADLSCTCATSCATGGTTGCDQNSAILVEKEEEVEEKDGESVSQKTENDTDTEEDSLNHKEEDNNNEEGGGGEGLGNNLVPKEMMSFHPSMEDLVELISESGVRLKIQNPIIFYIVKGETSLTSHHFFSFL